MSFIDIVLIILIIGIVILAVLGLKRKPSCCQTGCSNCAGCKGQIDCNSFDAVVFDMDGVIFDSERAVMDCWTKIAEKYNIPNIEEPYNACIGTTKERTKEIMLEAYGTDFPYDEYAAEASRMFHEKYDNGNLPMKDGVVELLTFLKDKGKKIAIGSSTRKEIVVKELEWAGILEYFDVCIGGDMVKRSKPAPDIFLKACKELRIKPERAYVIEDSYNGIRAAKKGKLRPIMVPDLLPPNDEMKKLSVFICENLLKVKEFLYNNC